MSKTEITLDLRGVLVPRRDVRDWAEQVLRRFRGDGGDELTPFGEVDRRLGDEHTRSVCHGSAAAYVKETSREISCTHSETERCSFVVELHGLRGGLEARYEQHAEAPWADLGSGVDRSSLYVGGPDEGDATAVRDLFVAFVGREGHE